VSFLVQKNELSPEELNELLRRFDEEEDDETQNT